MKKPIAYLLLVAALAAPVSLMTGCSVPQDQKSVDNYAKDNEIAARIKAAMYADSAVAGPQVEVASLNGVVQLSGVVETEAAKRRAEQIASATPGVVKVHNSLLLPTELKEELPDHQASRERTDKSGRTFSISSPTERNK